MSFRRSSAAISFVALLGLGSFGFSFALRAQRATTPTLDEILKRLEANLDHYDRSLPSLFCDEHFVSRVEPGRSDENAVADSIFRLKRTENPDHTTSLVESRDLKRVNGKPTALPPAKGFPSHPLSGAFEGGFAVVSLTQKSCMKYRLERIHPGRPDQPYVVDFETALTRENKADCLLQEKGKGRVFIDPASMEITRLEMTTPRHVIVRGNAYAPPVIGRWLVTMNYAPVVLDGDTFWMPSEITSRDMSTSEGFHSTTWTFEATYRNYHRLEVKSRILAGGETVQ
jgi:hypothetical protein